MMVKQEDELDWGAWQEALVGEFIGRWESGDGSGALVAFAGKDVVGLLFGWRVAGQFRPAEARFVPEEAFPTSTDGGQALLDEWVNKVQGSLMVLSTTGLRELPMGQMVSRLAGRREDRPTIDVAAILTPDVAHAATNNPQAHGFRNTRELLSRVDQLKAAYHYVTALSNGESAPLDYVATVMKPNEANARARAGTLIQYARKNGYLSDSSGAGRAGGQLTDLAMVHVNRIAQAGGRHV